MSQRGTSTDTLRVDRRSWPRARSWARTTGLVLGVALAAALINQSPTYGSLIAAAGVPLVVGAVLVAAVVVVQRRTEQRLGGQGTGGRGQRALLARALAEGTLPGDAELASWRQEVPVLHRRAEEDAAAAPLLWTTGFLLVVLATLAQVVGRSGVSAYLAVLSFVLLLWWPLHLRRTRRRARQYRDLVDRLGSGR